MNTLKRKLTAILLTFAMLFSLMPALPQAAEAAQNEVSGENGYISLSYENEGVLEKNITVNAILDGEIVDTISVSDAKASANNISVSVNDLSQYEIAGDDAVTTAGETGLISVTEEKLSADFKSWSCRYSGDNGLIINVNLRSPLAHPDMPDGYYDGNTTIEFRTYNHEILKMIYQNLDEDQEKSIVNKDIEINSVKIDWYENFGYGDSGSLTPPVDGIDGAADYRVASISNSTGKGTPYNVESLTINYNDGQSVVVPAEKLRFCYEPEGNKHYYIESNDDSTNVVYFYNESGGLTGNVYQFYDVRFVENGASLGANMPPNPTYEWPNQYSFVNWEYGEWDGQGDPFLPTTIVNDDLVVFAHKVSSELGGIYIDVVNDSNQLLNRIVELYNKDATEPISVGDIITNENDGFGIVAYDSNGNKTTEDYLSAAVNKGWQDGNSYYRVLNYDADNQGGTGITNTKLKFDEVAGIYVYFKTTKTGEQKNMIQIPVGNYAGDLAKMMVGDADDRTMELRVIQGGVESRPDENPENPTYEDLKALIKVSVDCSTQGHESKTTELLANTGDQEDSYTVAVNDNTATVTVHHGPYVDWYNGEYDGTSHSLAVGQSEDKTVNLTYDNGWKLADTVESPMTVNFDVVCDNAPGPDYAIDSFDKALITEKNAEDLPEEITQSNYVIPTVTDDKVETVTIPPNGSVTLLYSMTVEGNNGANFTVKDDGASLVYPTDDSITDNGNGSFTGTISGDDPVVFYVAKTFTAEDIDEDLLKNSATITTTTDGGVDPDENKDDETVPAEEGDETDIFAVRPADITIYMGGVDGYDAVVGEDGEIIEDNNSLPEPGFTVQLPDELDGIDVKDLTFREKDGKRTWNFETYDGQDNTTLYRLTPIGEDQMPTRVAFTNAVGEKIPSDAFEVGKEVNTSFDMTLYKGEGNTEVGDIVVSVNGKEYSVNSDAKGTLTVRGTTEKAQLANINNEPNNEKPAVKAEEGTTYAINGGNVQVADTEGIALLFDEIIASDADGEGNDRVDMLENKANEVLEAQEDEMAYDFKYLDLVDSYNGNAWVQASEDVTIYWPLPEGTSAKTDFTLLHFEGLHRDMKADDVAGKIENCEVETSEMPDTSVQIDRVTDEYVVLKTGETGFSPFALAWDADAQTGTDYVVDQFDKALVATAQDATNAGITNATNYNYPDENGVVTIERGEDVTLLYKLTVTGNANGKFMVTDKDTSLISPTDDSITQTGDIYSGTIGADGSTTFYVAKTFDAEDITLNAHENPVLVNSASIVVDTNGDGTPDPDDESGVKPGEEEKDEETDVTTEFTLTFEYDHAYALGANNERIPEGQTITVDCGDDFDFTARPNSGYILDVPTIDGRAELKANTSTNFTVENIISDVVVYVDATKQGGGIIVVPGGDDDDNPGDDDKPSGLNTEDHFSYVVGYEDGMVKPQRSITRAEVATIFYRLLEDDVRDDYDTTRNNFSDVTSDSWYNQTVSTLASMGILKGYEDGTFRPNASITRAEFAAIATRFFEETGATYEPGTFTDVTGDEWFAGAIMDAVNLGLIGGYEDGTVRPNNNITRAEACAIVNRTLGRVPDADHLLPADEMTTWPDNPSSAWFYADMQEATNGHEYEWITEDGNKIEEWTDILDKDWNDR